MLLDMNFNNSYFNGKLEKTALLPDF